MPGASLGAIVPPGLATVIYGVNPGGMASGLVAPTAAASVATPYALYLGFVIHRTPIFAD